MIFWANMINKLKQQLPFLLLLLITVLTFSTLLRPGYFPMHDDQQAIRLFEMDKCIKDGQIPCVWTPDLGYGYGYPQFNYYGPLPYYTMEVFHLGGLGYLDSVKAAFVLSVVLSALGMYLLGSALWGKWGGFLSALLFAFAPYRAVDMYVRGAVGEFWAMSFLPFIFWSILEIFRKDKKAILWLALSLAALITSHNITTLIFSPILVLWIIFLAYHNWDSPAIIWEKIKNSLLGIFWGFSLSAFFVLPAFFEKKFAHIETLLAGYFNYLAHFVSIKQLLFSSYWGYGSSQPGPYDEISLSVGLIIWTLPILLLILAVILKKKEMKTILFFVLIGWLALFFTHQRSAFIWKIVPLLAYVQFPWRFLIISVFSFSVAAGALPIFLGSSIKKIIFPLLGIVILTILFYSAFFRPVEWLTINDSGKFSGDSWTRQITSSIFDYLPIYASHPPSSPAGNKPEVISGKTEISLLGKGTDWQKWKVRVISPSAEIRLAIFDFPVWKVWQDGKEIAINHDNDLGLITFSLTSGEHEVYAKLTQTPVRILGNILTVIGLIGIPIFIIKRRKL